MSNIYYYDSSYLAHHGIKGQRWGVRRYQNPDGTLTAAGRRRVKRAEKQHERVMQATSKYKQKKEYKKFKKQTLSLYDAETKELIQRLKNDDEINKVTQTRMSEKQEKKNADLIKKGLEYTKAGVEILGSIIRISSDSKQSAQRLQTETAKTRYQNKLVEEKNINNALRRSLHTDADRYSKSNDPAFRTQIEEKWDFDKKYR